MVIETDDMNSALDDVIGFLGNKISVQVPDHPSRKCLEPDCSDQDSSRNISFKSSFKITNALLIETT